MEHLIPEKFRPATITHVDLTPELIAKLEKIAAQNKGVVRFTVRGQAAAPRAPWTAFFYRGSAVSHTSSSSVEPTGHDDEDSLIKRFRDMCHTCDRCEKEK